MAVNWSVLFDYLRGRKQAYHQTFDTPPGQEVLQDLARFCRATESTFHSDPRIAAVLEGRREVWLRIQEHLQLDEKQLWELRQPSQPLGTDESSQE